MKLKVILFASLFVLSGCDESAIGVNSNLTVNESQIVWHGMYNDVFRIEDKDAGVNCWITESRTQKDSAGISCLPKKNRSENE